MKWFHSRNASTNTAMVMAYMQKAAHWQVKAEGLARLIKLSTDADSTRATALLLHPDLFKEDE